MDKFVNSKCRSASFALHKIGQIRQFINKTTAEKLNHAFVICHLDYCNSLIYGLPDSQLRKLQLIQNSAARLIIRLRKRDSITPALQSLHWLPIHSRIIFKILLQTFQYSRGSGPTYLKDLLTSYIPARNLRSAKKDTLVIRNVATKVYGQRSFQIAAPHLCNNLPLHVKQKIRNRLRAR